MRFERLNARPRHGSSVASRVHAVRLHFICVGPGSTPRCPSGTPSMAPQKGSPAVTIPIRGELKINFEP